MNDFKYQVSSFDGGMDLFTERTKLHNGKYPLLINGRSRFGKITPIKKPKRLTNGLPAFANYQGLYAAGNFGLVFASGKGYALDFTNDDGTFLPIADLQLDPTVDTIYLELVPASTVNSTRLLIKNEDITSGVTLLGDLISPSPIAAVIQDGINQPWVVLSNGVARITQGYDNWQNSAVGREYVPIGKQMVFAGDILYISDGNQIFRSASGRPLDFMVAIDQEGNKINPSEQIGGAANVSWKVFYDTITCLGRVSSSDGSFYVGSPRNSFLVSPDETHQIYAEPTFVNKYVSNTGPLNQFSFIPNVNGDSVFIDNAGVRSFNAILQFQNAGRNSPFSLLVQPLFGTTIQQSITACGQFNNYTCFAIQSTYGNVVLWFDELRQVWDGIDIYSEVTGVIRQFAEVLTPSGIRKLLFLTTDGGVYEAFAGDTTELCSLYIGDWCTQDPMMEQQCNSIKVIVNNAESDGTVSASLFVDNQLQQSVPLAKTVSKTFIDSDFLTLPFGNSGSDTVRNIMFPTPQVNSGWKYGVLIQWNFAASITYVSSDAEKVTTVNPIQSQVAEYAANRKLLGLK